MRPQPNNKVTPGVRARRRRQRRSPASGLGRRGRLGFCCREARKIVRPVSEIEDDDRSLFDSQCEPPDEDKEARR